MSSPHTTVGQTLLDSSTVQQSIDALVTEVQQQVQHIKGPQPARSELKLDYDQWLKRSAQTRGRDLLYPYIGSGAGHRALVELADGSVKWDLITGIGVNFFGHSYPPLIREGLYAALSDTLKQGNLQMNTEPTRFSELLLTEAQRGSKLAHCFLTTSGAMANENALKIALQKHAPAGRVLAFSHCFMGRSIVMSQIGDSPANRVGIPLSTQVDYIPFWNEAKAKTVGKAKFIDMTLRHLERVIARYPGQHACFVFELIQGEGGFNVGDRDFFKALMEMCKAHNIAVWDDDIQTFGRGETMFAYDYFELGDYIDLLCVGKMTQVCATLYTQDYNPKPGLLSGTFIGDAPSLRMGQAIVEALRDGDFYGAKGKLAQHHTLFRTHIQALIDRHPEWFPTVEGLNGLVGGVGGMMRFTPFGGAKDKIIAACKALFDVGLIVFWCGHGPYHIRLLPPLPVMTENDWDQIMPLFEEGLARVVR